MSADSKMYLVRARHSGHEVHCIGVFSERTSAVDFLRHCIHARNAYRMLIGKLSEERGFIARSKVIEATKERQRISPDPFLSERTVYDVKYKFVTIHIDNFRLLLRATEDKSVLDGVDVREFFSELTEAEAVSFVNAIVNPRRPSEALQRAKHWWLKANASRYLKLDKPLEFVEVDVGARELDVDLLLRSQDGTLDVRFPMTNASARNMIDMMQIYLREIRSCHIHEVIREVRSASDDKLERVVRFLRADADNLQSQSDEDASIDLRDIAFAESTNKPVEEFMKLKLHPVTRHFTAFASESVRDGVLLLPDYMSDGVAITLVNDMTPPSPTRFDVQTLLVADGSGDEGEPRTIPSHCEFQVDWLDLAVR